MLEKVKYFFAGEKVLVAGASGMTGRNLYETLQKCKVDVKGTCFSSKDSLFIQADLTDIKDAINVTKGIDYLFICCAKTYNASVCVDNPTSMLLPNITMVSNLLEGARINNVKKVLYISSSTVYQESFKPLCEDDLDLNKEPSDIYMGVGWMKRYAEKLCKFYSEKYDLPCVIVRPTNIYGKYDKTDQKVCHFVPAIIKRALAKQTPFVIKGNGRAIKDFIHVDDLVRDLLKVMMLSADKYDVFNICSGQCLSILDATKIILGYCRHNVDIVAHEGIEPVPYKALSNEKFKAMFGNQGYIPFTVGMPDVIKWYR